MMGMLGPAADSSIQAAIACIIMAVLVAISFRAKTNHTVMSVLLFLFGACSIVAGVCGSLHHQSWEVDYGIFRAFAPASSTASAIADPLSCFFLELVGVASCAAACYCPFYLKKTEGHFNSGLFWLALLAFVYSMQQLVLCSHAVYFLVFWEVMSMSSAALVVTDFLSHKAKKAAIIYLGATRVSATLLLVSFLWLHTHFHSWTFTDWDLTRGSCLAPSILLFLGLAIKAGLWPFHQWLPYAHAEAPAPVSALMSGVMVKLAIYAAIRLFLIDSNASMVVGLIAFGLGIVSALWGILFAILENDMKRLLAFSTVENVGLIMVAVGSAIVAKSLHLHAVSEMAFAAALFHILNHAIYKPLLFQTVGTVHATTHTRELANWGGLSHSMPRTTALFAIAAFSVCAIPPFSGFASKWAIYQSLFQFATSTSLPLVRAVALIAIALLSAVGALSVGAFAKALGLGFWPVHGRKLQLTPLTQAESV